MIKCFFRDSLLYTLATLSTKGIGLLMLPIYVRYLSKEDYGTFDYLTALSLVLGVVVAAEISQAVMRFVADDNIDLNKKSLFISSATWFVFVSYFLFIVIIYVFSKELSVLIFDSSNKSTIVILAALACFSRSFLYFGTVVFRAQLESKKAALASFLSVISVALCSYLFLVVFDMGLKGVMLGQIIGQLVVIICIFFYLRSCWFRVPGFNELFEMLKFSSPLVISSLGVILSLYVDRIFLKEFLDLESVAIYGVAARFASVATLCVVGFQSALTPLIYNRINDPATSEHIRKLLLIYLCMAVSVLICLTLAGEIIVVFVAGIEYEKSTPLVILLCLSVLVHSAYVFFPGLWIAKQTKVLATINLSSALLNIVVNYFLIPVYGVTGAAYATVLSSFFYLVLNIYYSERFFCVVLKQGKRQYRRKC